MAKNFYTAAEAAQKLGQTEESVKALVREGKLREFRDGGSVNYKAADVDALVTSPKKADTPAPEKPKDASGSGSAEILLEPVGDSGIELATGGSDILSLDELDAEDTAAGTRSSGSSAAKKREKEKEGSSIPSVGVNVFDDDDLDENVDPLAQTAVTDIAGLGMEGIGSGSGILDLTRESDDTSLGAELLEEIYTDDKGKPADAKLEMGEDTRAGLDDAITEPEEEDEAGFEGATTVTPAATRAAMSAEPMQVADDPVAASLTALMVVALFVMWFAGLAAVAVVRGVTPSLVRWAYGNLALCAGVAVVVGGLVAGVTFLLARRRSS